MFAAFSGDVFQLCDRVRETAYSLHQYLRHGHLDKVYENGLAHRLRKLGIEVRQQFGMAVYDVDGTILGEYFADLSLPFPLMIEVKACSDLANEHIAQLLGYLRACRVEHGLLINFGAPKFQIRKFALRDAASDPSVRDEG